MFKAIGKLFGIIVIFTLGLFVFAYLAGLGYLGQPLQTLHFNLRDYYYHKTDPNKTHGDIVLSFSSIPEELLKDSTVPLASALRNEPDHIAIFQYVMQPARFVFKDEKFGFVMDYVRFGNFDFYQYNKEFYQAHFYPSNGIVDLEEGLKLVKKIVQTIDNAGWQRDPEFQEVLGELDENSITKRLKMNLDVKSYSRPLMVWKAKGYTLALNALVELNDKRPNVFQVLSEIYIYKDKTNIKKDVNLGIQR